MPTDNTPTTSAGTEGPRTETESRIWAALQTHPQTTAQVVSTAGVGRSTAAKALAHWAKAGLITRHDGDTDTPSTWAHLPEPADHGHGERDPGPGGIASPVESSQAAEPSDDTPQTPEEGPDAEPAPDCTGSGEVVPRKPERLRPGGLYGLVEDYLREHPGKEFGPSQISKHLNRSSGAINNALEKMADQGVAVQTQTAPKRFSLAPGEVN